MEEELLFCFFGLNKYVTGFEIVGFFVWEFENKVMWEYVNLNWE
jgi:hypothetical protein